MHGGDQHKQLLHVPTTQLASFPGLARSSLAVQNSHTVSDEQARTWNEATTQPYPQPCMPLG